MKEHPDVPSVEELFGPKPARPSHPKIVAADKTLSDSSRLVMDIADREAARLLVNTCLFDPPIEEEEISRYARRFGLSKRDAETEIRRRRHAD